MIEEPQTTYVGGQSPFQAPPIEKQLEMPVYGGSSPEVLAELVSKLPLRAGIKVPRREGGWALPVNIELQKIMPGAKVRQQSTRKLTTLWRVR